MLEIFDSWKEMEEYKLPAPNEFYFHVKLRKHGDQFSYFEEKGSLRFCLSITDYDRLCVDKLISDDCYVIKCVAMDAEYNYEIAEIVYNTTKKQKCQF